MLLVTREKKLFFRKAGYASFAGKGGPTKHIMFYLDTSKQRQ